jgi:hypothetical protein
MMTVTLEVMLRRDQRVFTEQIDYPTHASRWTAADMQTVLRRLLQSIDRVQHPDAEPRAVELRGLNWIVSPYQGQVVIAFEIPSASAVAGPFDVAPGLLEQLLVQAISAASPSVTVH